MSEVSVEWQSLAEELASAVDHSSLPRMLRSLLQTALSGLGTGHEGASERALAIARFAVAEWRRWSFQPWGLD